VLNSRVGAFLYICALPRSQHGWLNTMTSYNHWSEGPRA